VTITGTTVKPVQKRIVVPPSALVRPAPTTPNQIASVCQFANNAKLYAVQTQLGFAWPTTTAVFSTNARTGLKTTTFAAAPGIIRYSNTLAQKFGGPGRFSTSPGTATGTSTVIPGAAVTIWGIAVPGPGNPPCTHTLLGGPNPACVAAAMPQYPTGNLALGGPVNNFNATAGGNVTPGVFVVKALTPGTIAVKAPTGGPGPTNMASSWGYPFTTGKITISAPGAGPPAELFTITGMDSRTKGGAGTLQLVGGGLSGRTLSGPNANRAWVRLVLERIEPVPAISPLGLVATAGLMLLAGGYAMRRRLFSA
jgi:hypothetical protein